MTAATLLSFALGDEAQHGAGAMTMEAARWN